MKTTFPARRLEPARGESPSHNQRLYRAAICLALLGSSGVSVAQTTNAPSVPSSAGSGSATNAVQLEDITVFGKLDTARDQIVPDLGATSYSINKAQISALPQGENAPFNEVLLTAPGMAQDSAVNGDLHLRGEHANIQYRINDVLLPEGITGFGQELDTRFVDSLQVLTGTLPAQYGFRTAGVVDIHTKSGAFDQGGEAGVYGGSYDTIKPSVELGGASGNFNYYFDATFNHNGIGIENPTSSATPIHDTTEQYKGFTYLSYVLDDTSRLSFMGSAGYADFQVPNTPGLPAGAPSVPAGVTPVPWYQFLPTPYFDSSALNENQNEQNYYAVLAYQKSVGDFNLQVAGFGRESSVHFVPDPLGDLYFNGVASDVDRTLYSGGLQADASYKLGERNTLRGGLMVLDESLSADTTTSVFPVDGNGNPTGPAYPIVDNSAAHALFIGVYLQDEWIIVPKLTLNVGARFDLYYASFDKENQPSPRVSLIYQPTDATTMHAGYARYFTPPPLENVPSTTVTKFDGTSNASATSQDDPGKAERANYFDVGMSQKLAPGLQVGLDGYYKNAVNQLDDGLFGQTLILASFNYAEGRVYGVEFTSSYTTGGFSTYANVAYSVAQGQNWSSAQFLFDPGDLAYVQNHWIYLDHDQRVTGSFGASYLWKHESGSSLFSITALYGSGLRQDGGGTIDGLPGGAPIPNGASVPSYFSVGLGFQETFKIRGKERLKARLDIVNVTDNVYQLRSGTGVGVNAPQYGMRFGIFGGISYVF
jgi:outer membrane receptor protein involved in Fe transport